MARPFFTFFPGEPVDTWSQRRDKLPRERSLGRAARNQRDAATKPARARHRRVRHFRCADGGYAGERLHIPVTRPARWRLRTGCRDTAPRKGISNFQTVWIKRARKYRRKNST